MWPEVEAAFQRQLRRLEAWGLRLEARLHPGTSLYSYTQGTDLWVALPDHTDRGRLQAQLLGAVLGLGEAEVRRIARGSIERVVAHELGHALRFARGRFSGDPLEEERAADAVAQVLGRVDPGVAPILGAVVAAGGRLSEAAALHRHGAWLRSQVPGAAGEVDLPALEAAFRETYHQDVDRFSHTMTAWTWLDLVHPVPETWQEVRDVWL